MTRIERARKLRQCIDTGLDSIPKNMSERLVSAEEGAALVHRLIDAMRGNPLLKAIVDAVMKEKESTH